MLSLIATIAVCIGTYFVWRIAELLPDLIFRVSEIQRDLADLRRSQELD